MEKFNISFKDLIKVPAINVSGWNVSLIRFIEDDKKEDNTSYFKNNLPRAFKQAEANSAKIN